MNVTTSVSSRPTHENRRSDDRRANDRRAGDRRSAETNSPTARQPHENRRSEDRRNDDRRSGVDRRDRASVSCEARKPEDKHESGFSSFLRNFEESHSTSETSDKATPEKPELTPEQERAKKIDETGRVLERYSDYTNGGDEITSRDDYEKIAKGEKNEDFAKHLREENPDWTDTQVNNEVKSLQDNSRRLLDDREISDFYDTAAKGGDKDGKFSTEDLVAGRLKNDISKENAPNLSVDEINRLHEKNPALGNQAITNKYYHQGQELNDLLGGGEGKDFLATWPAFGSLASNSAGAVIRDDGVPVDDRISDRVAQGNRKVFEDIAPHYDSYIEAAKDPKFNYAEWAKKEGFGESDRYLQESFGFLEKARTTKDDDKKQEYLLASNVLAGRHEQGRLDPDIDNSTAPVTGTGVERGVLETFVDEDPSFYMPNGKGKGELSKLDVSKKIEAPAAKGLEQITDPEVRAALWKSLGKEGSPPESISGQELVNATGTEDWSNLNERMRTIAGLMVAGQRDPRMGEYVLGYDAPAGLSTVDHVVSLGKGVLENATPVGIVTSVVGLFS